MAHLKEKKPANFTTKEKAALKQPCACGSGKKFKVCCYGKTPAAIQAEKGGRPGYPQPGDNGNGGYPQQGGNNGGGGGYQQPGNGYQPSKQAGAHRHRG